MINGPLALPRYPSVTAAVTPLSPVGRRWDQNLSPGRRQPLECWIWCCPLCNPSCKMKETQLEGFHQAVSGLRVCSANHVALYFGRKACCLPSASDSSRGCPFHPNSNDSICYREQFAFKCSSCYEISTGGA